MGFPVGAITPDWADTVRALAGASLPVLGAIGRKYVRQRRSNGGYSRPSLPTYRRRRRRTYTRRRRRPRRRVARRLSRMRRPRRRYRRTRRVETRGNGLHIKRIRDSTRTLVGANASIFDSYTGIRTSTIEAALTNLRFYDTATNAIVTKDLSSGTYMRQILFPYIMQTCTWTNNYQVPVKCQFYMLGTRADTNVSADSYFTGGLVDIGNPSPTAVNVYPSDSTHLTRACYVKSSKKCILGPGKSVTLKHVKRNVIYEPAYEDTHAQNYQDRFGTVQPALRLEGLVGHDTTLTEVGQIPGGVDCLIKTTFVISYDAGINLKTVEVVDTNDTFTNGGVITMRAIPDNVAYSVS